MEPSYQASVETPYMASLLQLAVHKLTGDTALVPSPVRALRTGEG